MIVALHIQVKRILDNARKLQLSAEVPHQYDDKYLLAESLVRSRILAHLRSPICPPRRSSARDLLIRLRLEGTMAAVPR